MARLKLVHSGRETTGADCDHQSEGDLDMSENVEEDEDLCGSQAHRRLCSLDHVSVFKKKIVRNYHRFNKLNIKDTAATKTYMIS